MFLDGACDLRTPRRPIHRLFTTRGTSEPSDASIRKNHNVKGIRSDRFFDAVGEGDTAAGRCAEVVHTYVKRGRGFCLVLRRRFCGNFIGCCTRWFRIRLSSKVDVSGDCLREELLEYV